MIFSKDWAYDKPPVPNAPPQPTVPSRRRRPIEPTSKKIDRYQQGAHTSHGYASNSMGKDKEKYKKKDKGAEAGDGEPVKKRKRAAAAVEEAAAAEAASEEEVLPPPPPLPPASAAEVPAAGNGQPGGTGHGGDEDDGGGKKPRLLVAAETATYLEEVVAHFKTLLDEEERALLVGNVLEELAGKEQPVAADPICSRHVEVLMASAQVQHVLQYLAAIADADALFSVVSRCASHTPLRCPVGWLAAQSAVLAGPPCCRPQPPPLNWPPSASLSAEGGWALARALSTSRPC